MSEITSEPQADQTGEARNKFDNSFTVPLPPTEAWQLLSDVGLIASCMPGVELTEIVDDRTFRGKFTVALGPVPLTFEGVLKIEDLDQGNRRASIKAEGDAADGRAYGTASFEVEPSSSGCSVLVHTNLNLSGPAARFGQDSELVRGVASRALDQFAANLEARFVEANAG
jgi:carbon monoxide dehydrogenase subunit G